MVTVIASIPVTALANVLTNRIIRLPAFRKRRSDIGKVRLKTKAYDKS